MNRPAGCCFAKKARLLAFQTIIMQRENKMEICKQILLKRLQNSLRITESTYDTINPRKSSNSDEFPLLASFDISGSALRITMNNSIFRQEWEKSKIAGNIRNISVLITYMKIITQI